MLKYFGIALVIVGMIGIAIVFFNPYEYLMLICIGVVVVGIIVSLIGAFLEAKPQKSLIRQ